MKIFDGELTDGKLKVQGNIVEGCPVLGEGGDSTGVVFLAEGDLVYIPKRSPDLSQTLQLLSTILSTIATGVFQKNLGGDITTQTFATELAELKKQVDELKDKLK